MSVIEWLESIFGPRERPSRRKVFINKPVDWPITWALSDSVRQIGFLTDGDGNVMAIPTIAIDCTGKSPIPAVSPRASYYDRNPKIIVCGEMAIDAVAIPSGSQSLWSYSCPVNRMALCESVFISIMRKTVATVLDYTELYLQAVGGPHDDTAIAQATIFNNTVGFQDTLCFGQSFTLNGNDPLPTYGKGVQARWWDHSTDGTCDYRCFARFLEFDK